MYLSHLRYGFIVLFYKISICQWDEIQGMDLSKMRVWIFNHLTYEFFIKFFNNLWDNSSCLKGVDNRGGGVFSLRYSGNFIPLSLCL